MKRRDFIITIFGGAAATQVIRPGLGGAATSPKRSIIGVPALAGPNKLGEMYIAIVVKGLQELGYAVDRDLDMQFRVANFDWDRWPAVVQEVIELKPDVIFAFATAEAVGAKKATSTIPIVCAALALIAVLINPSQPAAAAQGDEVAAAARALGLRVSVVYARSQGELDNAIAACAQMGAGGLVVTADALFFNRQKEIVTLAAHHAIPAIYEWRDFVLAGGLASYGSSITDALHQAGIYTGKILGGAKIIDLPVVQTTKFEFVINLKTAKALGIDVPPMLSARADDVIE
jgi:putative tryptophan/tyrosine transport system substrate-binding protein